MTEGLYNDLNPPNGANANKISVHVLCPAIVDTNITTSGRNRGINFQNRSDLTDDAKGFLDDNGAVIGAFKAAGMPPSKIADYVFAAIQSGRFYVYGDNPGETGFIRSLVEARTADLLSEKPPTTQTVVQSPSMNALREAMMLEPEMAKSRL
jgi:hypothetical protein